MSSDADLQSLARRANDQIQRTTERARRAAPQRRIAAGWGAFLAWTALVAIVLLGELHVAELAAVAGRVMPGAAAARAGGELGAVLEQARAALEGARSADGALPEAIPHASLAAVVRYERSGSSYRLSMSSSGVTVVLDSDGNREVVKN